MLKFANSFSIMLIQSCREDMKAKFWWLQQRKKMLINVSVEVATCQGDGDSSLCEVVKELEISPKNMASKEMECYV